MCVLSTRVCPTAQPVGRSVQRGSGGCGRMWGLRYDAHDARVVVNEVCSYLASGGVMFARRKAYLMCAIGRCAGSERYDGCKAYKG